jgi:hemolysin D
VKVVLDKSTIDIDGHEARLEPGMSGSVEIKTGTRRVIEYVLSPLIKHGHESLHER